MRALLRRLRVWLWGGGRVPAYVREAGSVGVYVCADTETLSAALSGARACLRTHP